MNLLDDIETARWRVYNIYRAAENFDVAAQELIAAANGPLPPVQYAQPLQATPPPVPQHQPEPPAPRDDSRQRLQSVAEFLENLDRQSEQDWGGDDWGARE